VNKSTIAIILVAAIVLYFIAWPVPIDPVAWDAPADRGLTGVFERNHVLKKARAIDLGEHTGPEDVAIGPDGFLYVSTHDGKILKIPTSGRSVEVFAQPGGRPLGLEFDADGSLLVANAIFGVQRISTAGEVSLVFSEVNGKPLVLTDDIAVAADGTIYVSEASTKFGTVAANGTLRSSVLDMLEHGGNGLIVEYKPDTGVARVIMDGLNFANGVAVSEDQQYLLVAETGDYRIHRYWLQGPKAGQSEVIIDNLPGFPDNINNGLNGRFWVGLVAPRKQILDDFSASPFVRKMLLRVPVFLQPKPELSSHVIAITGNGEVLMNLQGPDARYPMMTGVLETRTTLFLTTLIGNKLPYLLKEDLL